MCFITNKKIKKSIDDLAKLIETNELERLRQSEESLKQTNELLKDVSFRVKSVRLIDGEKKQVRITYELPTITLDIDENGEPNKNNFFYAVNSLSMISVEDMQKIQKILNEIKENA